MINSDLHIKNDQFNVGSPFVILTSNPAVMQENDNSKFKSGVDPTDPNTVLLTLQEGNLNDEARRIRATLQGVLDKYKNRRP